MLPDARPPKPNLFKRFLRWGKGASGASGPHLGPLTLTAQLFEARVDHRKIIDSSRTSSLATQLLDTSADHRKIVSRAGSGHIFSPVR
jgi:hypothetical protein